MRATHHTSHGQKQRRALTLVELLVAIVIVGMLAAVALPVIVPALDSRRIRESSRLVTAYLHSARDTAMRNGRPVGVMFERYVDPSSGNALPGMSIVLRQVEVPPPYAGDMLNSTMQVVTAGAVLNVTNFPSGDMGWQGIVRIGDFVKLNHRGPLYQITAGGQFNLTTGVLQAAPSVEPWVLTPQGNAPNYASAMQLPYQIIRQPVKSAAPPIQLPEGVIVDLQFSGYSAAGFELACAPINNNDTHPVIVSFSPAGHVDRVYGSVDNGAGVPIPTSLVPTSPLHFLLGKRERQRAGMTGTETTPEEYANFRDLENLWVSIFPTTGLITSSEMAEVSTVSVLTTTDQVRDAIVQSRGFARSGKGMGGR